MLTVELVTPEKRLFSTEADEVTLTGELGEMGILPGHIPLVSALRPGPLYLKKAGQVQTFAVLGGMAQVDRDRVTILAEAAEPRDEIDVARAERRRIELEKEIREKSEFDESYAGTEAALARAYARITVAKG